MVEMDIYAYLDYRRYLQDRYQAEKKRGKHFSFRYFAKIAGFGSPSYLKMVIDGKRNLKIESIGKFVRALKLNKKETAYFETLVLFNQSASERERDGYLEKLLTLKPLAKLTELEKEMNDYYQEPYFVIIREMVALPDFKEDSEWLAKQIVPPIKPSQAAQAIETLLHLGLLKRAKSGKLEQVDVSLTTPSEVQSLEVCHFHRAMLGEAKEAIVRFRPEVREISSVTIPVPARLIPKIKKRMQDFEEEMMVLVNQTQLPYDEVFQLNMQFFPVTKTKAK